MGQVNDTEIICNYTVGHIFVLDQQWQTTQFKQKLDSYIREKCLELSASSPNYSLQCVSVQYCQKINEDTTGLVQLCNEQTYKYDYGVYKVTHCTVKRSVVCCKASLVGASVLLSSLVTSAPSTGIW